MLNAVAAQIAGGNVLLAAIAGALRELGGMTVTSASLGPASLPDVPERQRIEVALAAPASPVLALLRVEMFAMAEVGIVMRRGEHLDPNWGKGEVLKRHSVEGVPRLTFNEQGGWVLEGGGDAAGAFAQRTMELLGLR